MSAYDSLQRRYQEEADAIKFPTSWRGNEIDVDQSILYLKGGACKLINSIVKGESTRYRLDPAYDVRTFRSDKGFGFTEGYVNLLMLAARADGHKSGYKEGFAEGKAEGVAAEKERMRKQLGLED